MKLRTLLAALALATLAVPVASATHFYSPCMNIWRDAPPGWDVVCSQADWALHNPAVPLASCLASQLEVYFVGVSYDVWGALGCLP